MSRDMGSREELINTLRQSTQNRAEWSSPHAFLTQRIEPLLHFQQDILVCITSKLIRQEVAHFRFFKQQEQKRTLRELLLHHMPLKYELTGTVLGLMASEEVEYYFRHEQELASQMVAPMHRLISQHLYQLY